MNKIKIAFVYAATNYFVTGNYFDKNYYYFFNNALDRNNQIEVDRICVKDKSFNCKQLVGYDALLFYAPDPIFTPYLRNIKEVKTQKFMMSGDCHSYPQIRYLLKDYGITNFFFHVSKKYFYQFFPPFLNYEQIYIGIEKGQFNHVNMTLWKDRIRNKILNTGVTAKETQNYAVYKLRTKCVDNEHVRHIPVSDGWVGDKYSEILSKYRASIASTTAYTTLKYFEIPASGCLTFMEINDFNDGNLLGYTDRENSIFINEHNYVNTFDEYIRTVDDPKWEKIANNGREYALKTFNNDESVNKLVEYIKKYV